MLILTGTLDKGGVFYAKLGQLSLAARTSSRLTWLSRPKIVWFDVNRLNMA